jgi:hypothetical protein
MRSSTSHTKGNGRQRQQVVDDGHRLDPSVLIVDGHFIPIAWLQGASRNREWVLVVL